MDTKDLNTAMDLVGMDDNAERAMAKSLSMDLHELRKALEALRLAYHHLSDKASELLLHKYQKEDNTGFICDRFGFSSQEELQEHEDEALKQLTTELNERGVEASVQDTDLLARAAVTIQQERAQHIHNSIQAEAHERSCNADVGFREALLKREQTPEHQFELAASLMRLADARETLDQLESARSLASKAKELYKASIDAGFDEPERDVVAETEALIQRLDVLIDPEKDKDYFRE